MLPSVACPAKRATQNTQAVSFIPHVTYYRTYLLVLAQEIEARQQWCAIVERAQGVLMTRLRSMEEIPISPVVIDEGICVLPRQHSVACALRRERAGKSLQGEESPICPRPMLRRQHHHHQSAPSSSTKASVRCRVNTVVSARYAWKSLLGEESLISGPGPCWRRRPPPSSSTSTKKKKNAFVCPGKLDRGRRASTQGFLRRKLVCVLYEKTVGTGLP